MQRKYGKDGLVVMTVSLDVAEEGVAALQKPSHKFLSQKKAALENFLLNENTDFVLKKFAFESFPAAYLFTRQGKWKRFEGDDAEHKNIEKWVEKFLKAK